MEREKEVGVEGGRARVRKVGEGGCNEKGER